MGRKTDINFLENLAIGAGIAFVLVVGNGIKERGYKFYEDPVALTLGVVTAAGALSAIYREGRKKEDSRY